MEPDDVPPRRNGPGVPPARRPGRLRRISLTVGSALVAALAAAVVADVYGTLRGGQDGGADLASTDAAEARPSTPITVAVEELFSCAGYVLPADLDLAEFGPFQILDRDWVYANGGADAPGTSYRVTVEGASGDAVVLQGLEVVDVEPVTAPAESVLRRTCAASVLPVRRFVLDLSPSGGTVEARAGRGQEVVDFPLAVSATDPEVLTVVATTQDCFCRWGLELRWTAGGTTGTTSLLPPQGWFVIAPLP